MRSINTVEWYTGPSAMTLKSVSLSDTLLVKLFRYALRALLYLPSQLNRYLNSLDVAPEQHRLQQVQKVREGIKATRYQHIPARVWQRRSALIILLEQQQAGVVARDSVASNGQV